MGFLFNSDTYSVVNKSQPTDTLLHEMECKICPLNKRKELHHPKMLPTGDDLSPVLVYIMGEAPSEIDDGEGEHFSGKPGELLRSNIPRRLRNKVRFNNTIRCNPPENRDPAHIEIECCRPSIERDIELHKPKAIFGLGNVPLSWAGKPLGITLWRGRRFPVKIRSHVCWYYPMFHPAFMTSKVSKSGKEFKSDYEVAFDLDLKRAFREVEAGLPIPVVHTEADARKDIVCVDGHSKGDLDFVVDFLRWAGKQDLNGVDYETQNLRPYYADSVILTKAVSALDQTLSFAWKHPKAGWSDKEHKILRDVWCDYLLSEAIKAVQNLSFEMEWSVYFYGHDKAREVPWEDTLTQAFVLDERSEDKRAGALSLEFLCLQYFGINIKQLTQGLNKTNMKAESLSKLLPYNGVDSKYHRLLYIEQEKRIIEEGLVDVYREKVRQVPTVVLSQIKGLPVDLKQNEKLRIEYGQKLKDIEDSIFALPEINQFKRITGENFNPASNPHVVVILKDVLKTREGQTGGGWSTKEEVLSKIDHAFTKNMLVYRQVAKMKSTYIDNMGVGGENLYPDSMLHTNFGTCFTATGRLESDGPNLQNFPTRNAESKKTRRQIAAPFMAKFDLGQIDGRLIACGSRDKTYCTALWENLDIHAEWAKRLAYALPKLVGGKKNISDKDIMKKFRNKVKSIWVFALFYSAGLSTTAGRFDCTQDELRPTYDEFWRVFEGVKKWQGRLLSDFKELGYVQLFDGLRRRAPLGLGQTINTPIQGATQRVIMSGMNKLSETDDPVLQANIQLHDDLTFCFESEREFEDAAPYIVETMLSPTEFDWICVPLTVEVESGPNWADMSSIGTFSSDKLIGWPIRPKEFGG